MDKSFCIHRSFRGDPAYIFQRALPGQHNPVDLQGIVKEAGRFGIGHAHLRTAVDFRFRRILSGQFHDRRGRDNQCVHTDFLQPGQIFLQTVIVFFMGNHVYSHMDVCAVLMGEAAGLGNVFQCEVGSPGTQ